MNLAYKSNKLERSLTDSKVLKRTFGLLAKRVAQRMDQLRAANNLAELMTLPAANCHALSGSRSGEWAVDISGNYRLIFEIMHDPVPIKEDGSVNAIVITDIRLLETTDYH